MNGWVAVALAAFIGLGTTAELCAAQSGKEQAARAAIEAVRRAGGAAVRVTASDRSERGYWVTVDDRWRVGLASPSGAAVLVVDCGFSKSPHAAHKLASQPTPDEIEQAGREVVARVFPDFDMSEFRRSVAEIRPRSARAEVCWRQVIRENGFLGGGRCSTVFCWPDRAVESIEATGPAIPDSWRRPTTVTAEEAKSVALPQLRVREGEWVETVKDFCGWEQAARKSPSWNVTVKSGPEDRPLECMSLRSVFVDPWTGEIIHTAQWEGAGPAGAEALPSAIGGQLRPGRPGSPAALPTAQPLTAGQAERSAHGRWLLAAGAGILVLALAAAMVCARRRRA